MKVLTILLNYNFLHSDNTLYQLKGNFTLLGGIVVSEDFNFNLEFSNTDRIAWPFKSL